MSTETFDRIVKWAKLINRKPNCDCTHFYLSDNEKVMIIDLTRMAKMPSILKKLSEKEKSYLFIDLDNDKTARYYAYDVCPETFCFTGEKEGKFLFNIVEDEVLDYIETNASELTTEKSPLTALVEMSKGDFQRVATPMPPVQQPSSRHGYEGHAYSGHNTRTNCQNPYGNSNWQSGANTNYEFTKERDRITDTLYSLIKTCKTGAAVDYIHEFVKQKESDKEMLNSIFRFLSVDKMDIISLKELLIATESIKEQISERGTVFTKFQAMVYKAKPKKAKALLTEIQVNA